jgi:uncharacterized iron-regulated membrane protein
MSTQPLELSPPRGCTIGTFSTEESDAHVALAQELRNVTRAVASRPGSVTLTFAIPADDERIIRFVAMERQCCSFMNIAVGADTEGATVTYSGNTPEQQQTLFELARMFDPTGPATTVVNLGTSKKVGKGVGSICAIGVACGAACALPPLLAAGGIGALGGTLASGVFPIALAIVFAIGIGAAVVMWRARRRERGPGCSC